MVWYVYDSTLGINKIMYSYYDGNSWSEAEEISDRSADDSPQQPTVVVDSFNQPHVIWELWPPKLLYKNRGLNGWSSATQLHFDSQQVVAFSSDAALSRTDDQMYVVWSSTFNGYEEIFYNHADVATAPDTSLPTVTVTSLSTGESLAIGSIYDITWNASDNIGVNTITAEYTTDTGATYTQITTDKVNNGSYQWVVPNISSETVQVKITVSDAAGNTGFGFSGIFSISDKTFPLVTLLSPNGGEAWEVGSQQNIVWSATDNVGVSSIDIQYSVDGGNSWTSIVVGNSNSGTYIWTIPDISSSTVLIKLIAHDVNGYVSADISDVAFSVVRINNPPITPHSPYPLDTEISVALNLTLTWMGGDIDGDSVTYDVYFGTSNNPPKVSDGQTALLYDPGSLTSQTVHYWKVVAFDGTSSSESPLWTFTTANQSIAAPSDLNAITISGNKINLSWSDNSNNESGFSVERKPGLNGTYVVVATLGQNALNYINAGLNGNTTYIYRVRAYDGSVFSGYSNEAIATTANTSPNIPSNPTPVDGSVGQDVRVTLRWSGGDSDIDDSVTYDVYFGSDVNPSLVSSEQTDTFYNPGTLSSNSVYYWKIVSKDGYGDSSTSSLWYFVTGYDNKLPSSDPNGPYTGIAGEAIMFDGSGSTDPDGNIALYEWDIDNDEIYDYSSSSPTQSHTYAQQGTYTIKLRVTDNLGATDEALTTTYISNYTLTVDINGIGTVTSSLPGINCPTDCSEQYTSGVDVILTASPQTGYQLESWAGCDSPSGNQCIINMNADKTVTVSFIGQPTAVTISGRQMLVNGEIFTIKGVGYSPVPIGVDPETFTPYGDYFTSDFSSIYNRDLPLLREMGANTIRLWGWNNSSDHTDFLDKAYNAGNDPLYVIVTFWMGETLYPDITSSPEREQIKSDFRAMVAAHKNNPAVIMWSIGNELNADWLYGGSLDDLFSLVNEMAQEAHAEEGSNFHPVTTALLDKNLISTISTYNSSVTSLDIWGVNIYRGSTFESLFSDYETVSGKPLVILEYGIDAYDDANGDEYKNIGSAYQAEYAETLWNEISDNSDVCIGGTIMAYSDEWWKGKYSTDSLCTDNDPAYHGTCGYTSGSHPDGYSNEEWWGIMRTVDNGTDPDVMEPREVYSRLQTVWSGVDVILGDVNNDGTMDIVDALFIARYLIGLPVSNFNPDVADVNCDGSINIVDALFIARYLIGLPVPGWCGP